MTNAQVLDRYIQHMLGQGKSETTIRNYATDIGLFFDYLENERGATPGGGGLQASRQDLGEYLQYLKIAERAPSSINRYMAALRSFYAFTFSAGLMRLNVADQIKSFSVQKQNLAKWGTGNEIGRLIDAIDTQQLSPTKKILHKAIISVFLNSGLRVSELVALTLPDVDFAGQRIIVREGKNDKYRIVPMTKPEIARLKEWISLRKRGGLYVFQSERSDQLSVRAVQHILAKLREISGVDLSVHQLRHTFAKRYADANGIGAAAEVLGHSNINTTRVYTAPSMAQHIANANRIATEV